MSEPARMIRRLAVPLAVCLMTGFAGPRVAPTARLQQRPVGSLRPGARAALQANLIASPGLAITPQVSWSLPNDTSGALRSMQADAGSFIGPAPRVTGGAVDQEPSVPNRDTPSLPIADPVVQSYAGSAQMPAPLVSIKGLSNHDNVGPTGYTFVPPDPNLAAGGGFVLEVVNDTIGVWNDAGNKLLAPTAIASLWHGFGGICQTHQDGDPVVVYDSMAGRFVVSQFALDFPSDFHECVAVSKSGDPTGAWYRYDFKYLAPGDYNDYPKIGVWPDGYYMSANQFDGQTNQWAGFGATVFQRSSMLSGEPAQQIYFNLAGQTLASMLPASIDGGTSPPPGGPEIFAQIDSTSWGYGANQLELWDFRADWSAPKSSTFTHSVDLPVAAFNPDVCTGANADCISQPGTKQGLDPIDDRLMFPLQYRNFGDHEEMVVSHTVSASNHAAIRWYDLTRTSGPWSLAQQGTYAPGGNQDRWMGSAAIDGQGDIAIAYSLAGSSTYPSVGYAGRVPSDPAGTIGLGETLSISGGGSQLGSGRWGDYSALTVDPTDSCTSWGAQEYYASGGQTSWSTRITAFSFPGCARASSGPSAPVVSGTPSGSFQSSSDLQVGWSATGLAPLTYDVRYAKAKATGGFGADVMWRTQTSATSGTFSGSPGTTYCFQAQATDASSVVGPWSDNECTAVPMNDTALSANGRWARRTGNAYYLADYSASSRRGAALVRTGLHAKQIELIATECPSCGTVKVLWNGKILGKFPLRSATVAHGVPIHVASFGLGQVGTLKIDVMTAGKPVKIEGLGISHV